MHLKPHSFFNATLLNILVVTLVALPILYVFAHLFVDMRNDVWVHLRRTVLSRYVINSIKLSLIVAALSSFIGIYCAWFISRYQFLGRSTLQWALLLPMALPAYILAFSYAGLLGNTGSVQTVLRDLSGWQINEYWFPDIRSLGGAAIVLTLALYPYTYLLARTRFFEQSQHTLDIGRSLGFSERQVFFKIALPLARPAIIAGISLVVMETLADYGAVHYLGVTTLTTGIFRTWFGMNNLQVAMQLSAFLLFLIFVVLYLERASRQRAQYYQCQEIQKTLFKLDGFKNYLIFIVCFLPVLFGFVIPFIQLLIWAAHRIFTVDKTFFILCLNSCALAVIAAFLTSLCAIYMSISQRFLKSRLQNTLLSIAKLGYAIPGIVIAVGIIAIASKFDLLLSDTLKINSLFLSGSFTLLIYAYIVRFLTAALNNVENGFEKIHSSLDESAQSLGHKKTSILMRIHLPLMRGSILAALLMVFVDALKELPATLIMRPFNFNTLAVRAYELATDERLADAALPALAIVLTGLIPVIILSKLSLSPIKNHYE